MHALVAESLAYGIFILWEAHIFLDLIHQGQHPLHIGTQIKNLCLFGTFKVI